MINLTSEEYNPYKTPKLTQQMFAKALYPKRQHKEKEMLYKKYTKTKH